MRYLHECTKYIIEHAAIEGGKQYALDMKEKNKNGKGHCLVNLNWFDYEHEAWNELGRLQKLDFEEQNAKR
jgi:hypothetical protein